MLPIGIEIELEAYYLDSDLQSLITGQEIIYERDLKARKYRKKPAPILQQHLSLRVPGRKQENSRIAKYIESLQKGDKSPLCLHGSTGCGKTSIVTELINYLKEFKPEFRVLYVNCLNFTSVRGIYSLILEHFFSQKDRKPEQALSNIFMDPSKINATVSDDEVNLIILDEIDQCFSSKTFIYNILQWTQSSAFSFGSILISNMVDFSANVEKKSRSRIKFNSVIFAPYSYEELIEIVRFKYPDCYLKFENDAIVYLCKKVAGINSDVRLIQKYYTDSLRKFYGNGISRITIDNVQTLFVAQNQGVNQIIKPYQFILEIIWRSPKRKNIELDIEHYCLGKGIPRFKQNQVLYIFHDLQSMGVLKLTKSRRQSDFYYKQWGINLEELAFTLEATKSNK